MEKSLIPSLPYFFPISSEDINSTGAPSASPTAPPRIHPVKCEWFNRLMVPPYRCAFLAAKRTRPSSAGQFFIAHTFLVQPSFFVNKYTDHSFGLTGHRSLRYSSGVKHMNFPSSSHSQIIAFRYQFPFGTSPSPSDIVFPHSRCRQIIALWISQGTLLTLPVSLSSSRIQP